MVKHVSHGLTLLFAPSRSWRAINEEPYSPLKLAVFTAALAAVMFFFRTIGTALHGVPFPFFLLESFLFTLICVGSTLSIGLVLMPFARLARRRISDGHAMKLALYSATPMWLAGIFQMIPSPALRMIFLLGSLGYGCFLLFRGLPRLFQTEPNHTLIIALVAAATWVFGLTLFTQIFLPIAFAP